VRRFAILAVLALAAPAVARAGDGGFLADPTDQLAVPGIAAGAEITPEGNVYTGSAEVRFAYGARLLPWNARTRHMASGYLPVLRSVARDGAVRYAMTMLMDTVGGRPVVFVHVEATNGSARRAAAHWRAIAGRSFGADFRFPRPAKPSQPGLYTQPGDPYDPHTTYAVGDVDRSRPLAPHGGASFDVAIPVQPSQWSAAQLRALAKPAFAAHRAAVLRAWRARLAGAVRLTLPEPAVRDAFYASLVHILEPRYQLGDGQWVQAVNKLQYQSFWLRDAALMAQGLDLAGLRDDAAQDLGFFAAWQQADGLFISRPGQYDGFGQALWGLGEHARLTRDRAFAAARLDDVSRAMAWLDQATRADRLGLLPASDPNDNERVAGHLAGDDFWAVAGANAAVTLARVAGRDDLAARWSAQRDALAGTVVTAARRAATANHGAIPPALDARGGLDWGNLWAAWPYPVFAPGDRTVTATLRAARRRFAEGVATYGDSLHGYLGFRVYETELARGAQRPVVDGLYASLAHLTATDGCFEYGTRPYGRRVISGDLAPHGWCAAEIVALVRNMLVRERGSGVQLLAAVSPAWLGRGRTVALSRAPTSFGAVSVSLRSTSRGATLHWHAPAGVPVWWTVPAGARGVRLGGRAVHGVVRLPASSGSARIAWRLGHDPRSLARTRARLAAAYRRHHQVPPFGR
jgi:hypothetical protein